MSGHTPGPWWFELGDRSVYAKAFDGSPKYICDRVRGGSPDEAEVNLRLIRTAPELLLVLKRAHGLLDCWGSRKIGYCSGDDPCPACLVAGDIDSCIRRVDGPDCEIDEDAARADACLRAAAPALLAALKNWQNYDLSLEGRQNAALDAISKAEGSS